MKLEYYYQGKRKDLWKAQKYLNENLKKATPQEMNKIVTEYVIANAVACDPDFMMEPATRRELQYSYKKWEPFKFLVADKEIEFSLGDNIKFVTCNSELEYTMMLSKARVENCMALPDLTYLGIFGQTFSGELYQRYLPAADDTVTLLALCYVKALIDTGVPIVIFGDEQLKAMYEYPALFERGPVKTSSSFH